MGRPTINDVARLAGVSKKTVSRVINKSPLLSAGTRAKVEEVIAQLGYVPNPQARGLALGRSMLVALVHDGSFADHLLEVQENLLDVLPGNAHTLGVKRLDGADRSDLTDYLQRHRPFGIILTPPLDGNPLMLAACREMQTPVALLDPCAIGDASGFAGNRTAMAAIVDTIVALGHRRIALVSGPAENPQARARELGYLDAMAEHGLDRGPALIEDGNMTCASGRTAGGLLLEVSPRPTAILAVNDAMAAGVLQAAAERGVPVPEALSVTGFGDSAIARAITPPLSTMRIDWRARAAAAMVALLREEVHEGVPAPRWVERGSIAPPPA